MHLLILLQISLSNSPGFCFVLLLDAENYQEMECIYFIHICGLYHQLLEDKDCVLLATFLA